MNDRASSCCALAAHRVDVCWSVVAGRSRPVSIEDLSFNSLPPPRDGEKAAEIFLDDRYGHPYKLTEPVLAWLVEVCTRDPQIPSSCIQAELKTNFGIEVSIGHINHVRAQHGVIRQRRGQAQAPVKKP